MLSNLPGFIVVIIALALAYALSGLIIKTAKLLARIIVFLFVFWFIIQLTNII